MTLDPQKSPESKKRESRIQKKKIEKNPYFI